jgi:hypothetical protein
MIENQALGDFSAMKLVADAMCLEDLVVRPDFPIALCRRPCPHPAIPGYPGIFRWRNLTNTQHDAISKGEMSRRRSRHQHLTGRAADSGEVVGEVKGGTQIIERHRIERWGDEILLVSPGDVLLLCHGFQMVGVAAKLHLA